jgi:hypothetical protein
VYARSHSLARSPTHALLVGIMLPEEQAAGDGTAGRDVHTNAAPIWRFKFRSGPKLEPGVCTADIAWMGRRAPRSGWVHSQATQKVR